MVSGELDDDVPEDNKWKALLLVTEVAHAQGPNLDLAPKSALWERLLTILEVFSFESICLNFSD